MSDEISDWETEGGAVDFSPSVVLVVPQSSLDDKDVRDLIAESRRERVRVQIVPDSEWKSWQLIFEAMDKEQENG